MFCGTTARSGTTRVWDAETGRPLAVMHEHADAINAVAVSPVDNTIMTAGADGTARLYPCRDTCVGLERVRELAEQRLTRASAGE